MTPLGLTSDELAAFQAALSSAHTVRVEVNLLDKARNVLSAITPRILDGQVDVDAGADVTRLCTMQFLDPAHALQLDSNSPDDGALYADRLLQVFYSVRSPLLAQRVRVPVFTGILAAFERDGVKVSVDALGLEEFGMSPAWNPLTLPAGMKKTDAIVTLLRDRAGETVFDIPDLPTQLATPIVLGRLSQPWLVAQSIAESLNRQLYYDGAGVCRLRAIPGTPTFGFVADQPTGSNIVTPVKVSHDFTQIKNTIWVHGGAPSTGQAPIETTLSAPFEHPLSPWKLGRNDVPRFLVEEVSNDNLRNWREVNDYAQQVLNDRLTQVLGVTFGCVPIPHLDPLDVVTVLTSDFAANVRTQQFSFPLTTGGQMSFGYISRVSNIRRRGA